MGSLPLLSPAFRRSHFRRQVPVLPQRRERSKQRKVELWARKCPVILSKFRLPLKFRDLSHAANLRPGTDGFTSVPKKGVLRFFFALKCPTVSAGFEHANLGTKGQHATPRPQKPLNWKLLILFILFHDCWNLQTCWVCGCAFENCIQY